MIDRFFSYVIDRIQQFIDGLQIDTSRASLGVWIAIINVAIVLLLVGGISISAIGSLRAINSGAVGETEVGERTGLSLEELRTQSFVAILRGRRG